jgi:UDP-glucuronate decarboxylase
MRHDDGGGVFNMITQALRGVDITIYGDGPQTRSFCYIDDVVDGLVRLANYQDLWCAPQRLVLLLKPMSRLS